MKPSVNTAQACGGTRAVGHRYGWSRSTVLRKIHRGDFPASRDGDGDYRVRYTDVDCYLARHVVVISNEAKMWADETLRKMMHKRR